MVTHYHGEVRVDWTDNEWERLRAIKDDPAWKSRGHTMPVGEKKVNHTFSLSPFLIERAKMFAVERDVSFSGLVELLLRTITEMPINE